MEPKTRSKQQQFLLPKSQQSIPTNKLPTKKDVICHYYFLSDETGSNKSRRDKIYCKLNKNFEVDCDDEKCSCILKKILTIYRNA